MDRTPQRQHDRSLGYTKTHDGSHKKISHEQDQSILKQAVHTQHKGYMPADLAATERTTHTKTEKKRVIIPVEETIEVPVYRQSLSHKTKTVIVQGKKMIPTTRYKEVEETVLQTVEEMVNGRKEKRAIPVVRKREIPYTHYEAKMVDIEVQVPDDEVVQQIGTRMDKHVVSKVVEVEEDHVYEMRPVLISKGEKRMKELGEHHAFKKEHGACTWDGSREAWKMRPKTPEHRMDLPRPGSASSVRSVASSIVMPRLKTPMYSSPRVPRSQNLPGKF